MLAGDSDDDDAHDEEKATSSLPPTKAPALPSAASLLARQKPAWIEKPSWAQKKKPIISPRRVVVVEPENAKNDDVEAGADMYEFYDPAKGWQNKQATSIDDPETGYRKGGPPIQRPPPTADRPVDEKKKKRPNPSKAKERTKQQRLAGQSGIGDDFRVWRSEEEMRMRQQFDS